MALHVATYRARPDVRAIVHLHPQTALLLDAVGERIRLAHHRSRVLRAADRRRALSAAGLVGARSAAAAVAARGHDCILLRRHGCSVLGDSVEMALRRALNLEEAARLTYRALALGRADALTDLEPPTFA